MLELNNELFRRRRLCTFPPVNPGTGGCQHCGERVVVVMGVPLAVSQDSHFSGISQGCT